MPWTGASFRNAAAALGKRPLFCARKRERRTLPVLKRWRCGRGGGARVQPRHHPLRPGHPAQLDAGDTNAYECPTVVPHVVATRACVQAPDVPAYRPGLWPPPRRPDASQIMSGSESRPDNVERSPSGVSLCAAATTGPAMDFSTASRCPDGIGIHSHRGRSRPQRGRRRSS